MLLFGKGEDADVVDLILYSVPNTLHAEPHVGKRQNTSLGYVDCIIQHRQTHTHTDTHTDMMKTLPLPHTREVINVKENFIKQQKVFVSNSL